MSLLPGYVIDDIAKSVLWADCMVRSDLALGFIANENDYTSNLTSTIRRQINSKNRPYLRATSVVLKAKAERRTGCDACILISNTREFKVCLFEAKLPRLSIYKNSWDYLQKRSGLSHFSEQIKKQCSLSNKFAVWEMFYCDFAFGLQPSCMNYNTSSCVWHSDASAKVKSRNNSEIWTDTELKDLLIDATSKYSTQIDQMIREVCLCNKGEIFKGNEYSHISSEYDLPTEALLIEFSNLTNSENL